MGPVNSSGRCFPSISKSSNNDAFKTPKPKKTVPTNRSPPSNDSFVTPSKKESPPKSNDRNSSAAMHRKVDHKKPSDWKIEVAVPNSLSLKVACEDGIKRSDFDRLESGENENSVNSKSETKHVLFGKIRDEKVHKFGGLRSGSRVVPFQDDEDADLGDRVNNINEEIFENSKDDEDMSLIREQLLQIENQQSNLFELLQVLCPCLISILCVSSCFAKLNANFILRAHLGLQVFIAVYLFLLIKVGAECQLSLNMAIPFFEFLLYFQRMPFIYFYYGPIVADFIMLFSRVNMY